MVYKSVASVLRLRPRLVTFACKARICSQPLAARLRITPTRKEGFPWYLGLLFVAVAAYPASQVSLINEMNTKDIFVKKAMLSLSWEGHASRRGLV